MSDVEVFPTGQRDGGRDITVDKRGVVLQVKFSKDRRKNPVTWLKSAVQGEDKNIRRLVEAGCERYILMTNIEGSAASGSGDRDKLNAEFEKYERTYGIPMSPMWCSDIDAWVDLAGASLKLAYVDMLTGSDALVALLQSTSLAESEEREKSFLQDYVGTHWSRDRTVKFTQIELRSNLLTDLFVDVTATRVSAPKNASGLLNVGPLDGLAAHLLSKEAPPFTLLEGVPGQGKSTASQYVCQAHRVAFLDRDIVEANGDSCPKDQPDDVRLPIRIDLADYALWASGIDPLASEKQRGREKPRSRIDIELFLVKHFQDATTDHDCNLAEIRGLLDRLATLIVFDGLDEVADLDMRATVVSEIDAFISRRRSRRGDLRVVITTRPNSSGLPEPSADRFQRLRLDPMDAGLRKRYLRQWAKAQDLDKPELRTLERIFDERTAATHVAQLANNPMQLALLLHLIRKKGEALPTARTALYRQYMDLFLEREVEKSTEISPVVKNHRQDIEEAAAYVGWYMQGRAEIDAAATRLPKAHIIKIMTQYLTGLQRDAPVQEIFDALNQRVWVLTSKQVGTYEFDVQSIREYVTARYLHEYAETLGGESPPRAEMLSEMLWRPYWANTARFLAGHFSGGNLAELVDVISERFELTYGQRQTRATMWSLLADGVFQTRPRPQERLASALADDMTVAVLHGADTSLDMLAPDYGGSHFAAGLLKLIEAEPAHPANGRRGRAALIASEFNQRYTWWIGHMSKAAGTKDEASWLATGLALDVASTMPVDTVEQLRLDSPTAAGLALRCGVAPSNGSPAAKRFLDAVLDGWCSAHDAEGDSEAADLLTAFAPSLMLRLATGASIGSDHRRTTALTRLKQRNLAFEQAARALRTQKGTKGTTSRWTDTAVELAEIYRGPRWLFTEIAAVALLLDRSVVRTGGMIGSQRPVFGEDMHYGTWVAHIRTNADNLEWWKEQCDQCIDEHSQAAWALSLTIAATGRIIGNLVHRVEDIMVGLSESVREVLLDTSQRLGSVRLGRRLSSIPRVLDLENLDVSIATRLLLAHHSDTPANTLGSNYDVLVEASQLASGADFAAVVATRRATTSPTIENLDLVKRFRTTAGEQPRLLPSAIDAATYILRDPGQFPVEWVLSAERVMTGSVQQLPLRTHAENAWSIN